MQFLRKRGIFRVFSRGAVGVTIGRPRILQGEIHRRQAKRCFSADEQCAPLQAMERNLPLWRTVLAVGSFLTFFREDGMMVSLKFQGGI